MFKQMLVEGVPKLYTNECANDLWVREIVFPGRRNGYFVEAGAADGVAGSSCFFLEKHLGWNGICIEPHQQSFTELTTLRPSSHHVCACLADVEGEVDFAELGGQDRCLSGVRDVLLTYKYGGAEAVSAGKLTRRPALTLSSILDRFQAPAEIDYAAFDIEGSEYEALRNFSFHRYRFLAMSLEVDGRIEQPLDALLRRNGYRKTGNPFNTAFPHEQYWLHETLGPSALLR